MNGVAGRVSRLKVGMTLAVFAWSIFMGITVGSIALGAVYPPINYLAAPFVGPRGVMDYRQQTYHTSPGSTTTTVDWTCTDRATGKRTELDIFPMSLYPGSLFGLLLFVVVFAGGLLRSRGEGLLFKAPKQDAHTSQALVQAALRLPGAEAGGTSQHPHSATYEKMKELEKLHAMGLISDADFEAAEAQVLDKS